ncbi:flagellar motor protein MotB [Cryobacterium sp. PH31-AA6]|uniref:OmpA/MotB family protein n=1 Tax=Cryobacterium sp. PH31-AA6 TaxID=3046205 RepID=UPI0024BB0E31|nr:flagellar motor protein MotB [Cryobacterium sp. PH31-AA6]MDJ0325272.1 flagellar motor protein MotB [Cryobacterium sp. PH31-AA6]
MSGHGRGRGKGLEEEHVEHVDERWMASYMDMVTVLMCMFIVLFAMSSVDQEKFVQLKNSLATGFGATDVGKVDTAKGVVVKADKVKQGEATGFTDLQLAVSEVDHLKSAQKALQDAVDAKGIGSQVQFVIDSRGLTIGLIGSEAFFAPNLANLSSQAIQVLDTIAPILAAEPNEVKIEGHADRHGVTTNYPTDWELSSGRATAVLRRLVEHGGIAQERISAVGYGSARPVAAGSDLAAMAQNRRVDVVMLSNQPEAVRALIPSVLDGTAVIPPPAEPAATTTKVATSTKTEKLPAKTEKAPAKTGH